MPLKTIKICPKCEKKTCDGSVWKAISCIPTIGPDAGKETIQDILKYPNSPLLSSCGLEAFGRGSAIKGMKIPQGPVGTKATRHYINWVHKDIVVYEKIED